ncbi:transposase, partial [Crocosphaera watsonii]
MTKNETATSVEEFLVWRSNLFQGLKARKETIIELLDALSSNQQAHSVVELSLNPLFRRDYNSLYRGIQEFLPTQTDPNYEQRIETLFSAVSRTIPPTSKHYNLFGIDTTPCPRRFAETLADKTFIHYPNPIKGNRPINIGHCYSVVCALPDQIDTEKVPWAVPLSGERVPSKHKGVNQGNQQLKKIWQSSLFSDNYLSQWL